MNNEKADIMKIDADDGDVLLVTMPEHSVEMNDYDYALYADRIANGFERLYEDKEVRILVVPYGIKVEIIKADTFNDAEQ